MSQNLSLTALEQRDEFIARHIGSPSEELDAMLDAIGAPNRFYRLIKKDE